MKSESSQKPRGLVPKSGSASKIVSTAKSLARVVGSNSVTTGSSSGKPSLGDRVGGRPRILSAAEDASMTLNRADVSPGQSWGNGGKTGIGRFRLEDVRKTPAGSLGTWEPGVEDGLECPVCWEAFNDQDNTPYVLWCGHTLCRNCVMGLRWAMIKLPGLTLQMPLFIQCPWCQFLTARLTWKGCLKMPSKNYFVLWIAESVKAGDVKQGPNSPAGNVFSNVAFTPSTRLLDAGGAHSHHHQQNTQAESLRPRRILQAELAAEGLDWRLVRQWSGRLTALFLQFTAKLPLILLLLFIVFYVLPFSSLVLLLYCVITVVFAVPCFLIVYFSYPSLDWLVREILS